MRDAYVVNDKSYVPVLYKEKEISISNFLCSTKNDIISTDRDQMIFIKAFLAGYFWPKERLEELEKWNRVFFSFEYGVGIQNSRYRLSLQCSENYHH